MGVDIDHLHSLYAETHDPWDFEHSTYEQNKFKATRNALSQPRYNATFELGCGNGQLARHLVQISDRYTGMDAVEKALSAARQAVPTGTFVKGFYPCPLPDDTFDLIVLSEILYFLNPQGIGLLASDIGSRWPNAEVICVTWLGPSGNELQGDDAAEIFKAALVTHYQELIDQTENYSIYRGLPGDGS
jgi:SAM-dependent methyltransferase